MTKINPIEKAKQAYVDSFTDNYRQAFLSLQAIFVPLNLFAVLHLRFSPPYLISCQSFFSTLFLPLLLTRPVHFFNFSDSSSQRKFFSRLLSFFLLNLVLSNFVIFSFTLAVHENFRRHISRSAGKAGERGKKTRGEILRN